MDLQVLGYRLSTKEKGGQILSMGATSCFIFASLLFGWEDGTEKETSDGAPQFTTLILKNFDKSRNIPHCGATKL